MLIRLIAFLLYSLLSFAHGSSNARTVRLPITKTRDRPALKRDTIPATLQNRINFGRYMVDVRVGSPGQNISLQLETASSDTWMLGLGTCKTNSSCLGGQFQSSESSTFNGRRPGFDIQYAGIGSRVEGYYFCDNLAVGGATIKNLTMAVASVVQDEASGVLGIGFDTNELAAFDGQHIYSNLIDEMVGQHLISSRTYSLWLDDIASSTGTILFGGCDTSKYHQPLTVLPMVPNPKISPKTTLSITTPTVNWTSLTLTGDDGETTALTLHNFSVPAVLDSGTTLTYVPGALLTPLVKYFNAELDPRYGYLISCSAPNASLTYSLGSVDFPQANITVPFSELVLPVIDQEGNVIPAVLKDGTTPACNFGFANSDLSFNVIGDTFLRSAYVVYDLDKKEVGIAQADRSSSTPENIVEIGEGGVSVCVGGGGSEQC